MLSLIRITVSDIWEAREISRKLVNDKLAVSCQIVPVDSIYRWEGNVVSDKEYRIEVLTLTGLFGKINECVCDISSYELTEVVEVSNNVTVSQEIKNWVIENMRRKDE